MLTLPLKDDASGFTRSDSSKSSSSSIKSSTFHTLIFLSVNDRGTLEPT